jgi:hypothetical protein|tara:strand:- start:919 stop:1176 length:258 start_codon:yes stop_codon:yes gene_type:complete
MTSIKRANMSSDLLNEVVQWRKEQLPLSKQDIVNEISRRLETIVVDLLEKLSAMDKRINDIALQQQNIINYVCKNKSHLGYFKLR